LSKEREGDNKKGGVERPKKSRGRRSPSKRNAGSEEEETEVGETPRVPE